MDEKLWKFTDNFGSFQSQAADKIKSLYFPLANEVFMSSITPDLHGDIKTGQNYFLLQPVSRIDLTNLKSSRNFWVYVDKDKIWSASGASKDLKTIKEDKFNLEAGLLWHKVTRENRKIGLKAEILSFVPSENEPVEIMQVKLTNISSKKISFISTAAIPIYARSAENLRDHRHVTSLLARITLDKFGVITKPTLAFDETGHHANKTNYFVLGWDEKFKAPEYIYPTQEAFCGDEGDLEAPASILKNTLPGKESIQGKEVMGALRFGKITLSLGQSRSYVILMGITEDKDKIKNIINKFSNLNKVSAAFKRTKDFWVDISQRINVSSGSSDFDNWLRWVSIQPALRKIFGCSFLPDFDYGKGGRGWRDLWQDCLGLILNNPQEVRALFINNFSGVRIDGSNATIIGKKPGEFISDRNNISRVWMDHGVWPLLTLDLYINETGDFDILFAQTPYFRNHEICRVREIDYSWGPAYGLRLKTARGKVYKGTLLEHLLIQNLVQFFNVGPHNHVCLEGADWNDGLDMARENGESVAFSAMYAHNLAWLSGILLKIGSSKIKVAKELKILLGKIDYGDMKAKQRVLQEYFEQIKLRVSGEKITIDTAMLANNLRGKADWMMKHIRKSEWLRVGFFNGYYNNDKKRVEGRQNNILKMALASQVFPIMSGTATAGQINSILKSCQRYLLDKKIKGYHLNTDFKREQHNLGRAFSFIYGDKENGAFFNHMILMFAYALYERGLVEEGWRVLSSIYNMALDTEKSKIYPCLPEYFNLEGRGMYSYLTGSASWFMLTLLTQVFGVKGHNGNLLIEPKLNKEQFKDTATISICRIFAGRSLRINFTNRKRLTYGKYKIIRASLNAQNLPLKDPHSITIPRKTILNPPAKLNTINIILS